MIASCFRGARGSSWTRFPFGASLRFSTKSGALKFSPEVLAENLLRGERAALARAVTLIESTLPAHAEAAAQLLDRVAADAPASSSLTSGAFRIGFAGSPGAGKSTLIEALGSSLVDSGLSVAVLAVDPSSAFTGGSILGDKTRMTELARNPRAFVRPSPSRGTLGGVAQRTHDVITLCDAAGFDYIIVESVGLGQSEILISDCVDMTCLVVPPAAGDDLQGVKRGIMEVADLVVVNKADGDMLPRARAAATDARHALQLMRTRPERAFWRPRVALASALRNPASVFSNSNPTTTPASSKSDDEKKKKRRRRRSEQDDLSVWSHILEFRAAAESAGQLAASRADQRAARTRAEFERELLREVNTRFENAPEAIATAERDVRAGRASPRTAASNAIKAIFRGAS